VREAVRTALTAGACVSAVGCVLLLAGARLLMSRFTSDETVIAIGTRYLHIAAFVGFAYVTLFINLSALQGLKRPVLALWLGLGRQIVAPLIVFTLATRVWHTGLDGIWWGIFGITWTAALLAIVLARREVSHAERMAHDEHHARAASAEGSLHGESSPA
jgi:Na+-driven multidrug efflux pump